MEIKFKALKKSEPVIKVSTLVGNADVNEEMLVSVYIRSNPLAQRIPDHHQLLGSQLPLEKKHSSIEDLESSFGATVEDIKKVEVFAKKFEIDVVEINRSQRFVVLRGTPKEFSKAFQVKLEKYNHPKHEFRSHRGEIQIPEDLDGIIKGVYGLDTQFAIEPKVQVNSGLPHDSSEQVKARYSPSQIGKVYKFPNATGKGQAIAIIALGGGYDITDIHDYLKNIENVNIPKISDISILGAKNKGNPNPYDKEDFEINMDLEIVASIANEAEITVYFAPNNSQGIIQAFSAAIFDKGRRNSVITMSWGSAEIQWNQSLVKRINGLFKAAADIGITICLPSGDYGSGKNSAQIEFPASSPFALCCGGTKLSMEIESISDETVGRDLGRIINYMQQAAVRAFFLQCQNIRYLQILSFNWKVFHKKKADVYPMFQVLLIDLDLIFI